MKTDIDFDKFSIEEIKDMIARNETSEQDVINFYNNEWWDDEENRSYET